MLKEIYIRFISITATECKDWLLHYSVPIMTGIQELEIMIHYSLLVTAMYLLNKQSVSRDEIGKAEKCLMDFCRLFPDYYGNYKAFLYSK